MGGRRVRNYITGLWNFYLIQPIGIDSDLQRRRMPAFNTLVWFEWPFPLADSSNDVFIRFRTEFFWASGGVENSKISVGVFFLYIIFVEKKNTIFSIPTAVIYNDLVSFYRAHDHYFYFGRLVYLIQIFKWNVYYVILGLLVYIMSILIYLIIIIIKKTLIFVFIVIKYILVCGVDFELEMS